MCEANLQTIIADWLVFLKTIKRYSTHTLEAYQQDISSFLQFLTAHEGRQVTLEMLTALSVTTLRSWLADRLKNGLNPRSTARALSAVKGFYRFLEQNHKVINAAIQAIKSPRLQKLLPRPLNLEQTSQLLDDIDLAAADIWVGDRDRAVIILLYATGMRISEALSLKADILPLSDRLTITGKGNKQRVVPILPEVINAIETYVRSCPFALSAGSPLFVGKKGGCLQPGIIQKTLRLYRRTVGLPESLTPHALRHTCATHLMEGSHDLRSIQELLGHASLSSTQIYTNLDHQQLLQAYRQFHPRNKTKES